MADIKQAATNTVSIALGIDISAYPSLEFGFYQNGREVFSYQLSDGQVSEDGVITFIIPASDSAKLSSARVLVEIRATNTDSTDTVLSDGIVAVVGRSAHSA